MTQRRNCSKHYYCMITVPIFLRLGKLPSQVVFVLYIVATLYFRFLVEAQFQGFWWVSILFGALCLLFLWALVKVRVLNPGWIGAGSRTGE